MNKIKNLAIGAGVALGLSAVAAPLSAGAAGYPANPWFGQGASHAVFVQTDNTAGNQVVAYQRSDDGTLALAGTYNTGGAGGELNGSAVDHLASQGSPPTTSTTRFSMPSMPAVTVFPSFRSRVTISVCDSRSARGHLSRQRRRAQRPGLRAQR